MVEAQSGYVAPYQPGARQRRPANIRAPLAQDQSHASMMHRRGNQASVVSPAVARPIAGSDHEPVHYNPDAPAAEHPDLVSRDADITVVMGDGSATTLQDQLAATARPGQVFTVMDPTTPRSALKKLSGAPRVPLAQEIPMSAQTPLGSEVIAFETAAGTIKTRCREAIVNDLLAVVVYGPEHQETAFEPQMGQQLKVHIRGECYSVTYPGWVFERGPDLFMLLGRES